MKLKLSDVAKITGAELFGNADCEVTGLAKIQEAKDGDLTFLYLDTYEKFFADTKATAIFVKSGFNKSRSDINYLEVKDPNRAFFLILIKYFSPNFKLTEIDATAQIHPSASLGKNVGIGKNVVIGERCKIGDDVTIYHNTVLMNDVSVGNNTLIFPNVSVREECIIGNNVIIHSGTVIGSDGFGYVPAENRSYIKVPQIGNVIIEDDVEIGSNVSIDRAALGSTIIKRGVKIDNLVQIAHNVVIGEDTAVSGQTGFSGSATIGNRCVFAGQVGVAGHIQIADDVIIAAQSGVSKTITKAGTYFGYPAKDRREALRIEGHLRNLASYAERIKELEKKLEEMQKKISS